MSMTKPLVLRMVLSAICWIEIKSFEVGAAGVGVSNMAQRLSMYHAGTYDGKALFIGSVS